MDTAGLERLIATVGVPATLLFTVFYAVYKASRFGAPMLLELIDSHKRYLSQTVEFGHKQTEILERMDSKLDALHAKIDRWEQKG